MIAAFILLVTIVSIIQGQQGIPQLGTVALIRNGQFSNQYSSGRVIVYYRSSTNSTSVWGNICRLTDFGLNEANVICHQLTYSGASSWSYAGVDSFGPDNRSAILSTVSCSNSRYLSLFQCSVSTVIPINCGDSNDISVTCISTRIWNSPSSGKVRLTGGNFTNEGLVEVYCNGQWGTVCDDTFTTLAGSAICRELGYNQYISRINSTALTGIISQPIWLNSLSCGSSSVCLSSCQRCPSSRVSGCSHTEDVTVICASSQFSSRVTNTISTCPISNSDSEGGLSGGAIAGIVIGSLIGAGIIVGFVAHIDQQNKRKGAAQRAAAAQHAAPSSTPAPAPAPVPTAAVTLTSVTPAEPPPKAETPPTVTSRPPPPPYPGPSDPVEEEEKRIDHEPPAPYNPTAPSYPTDTGYPTGYNPGYPPPTNPGYPPPTNPGYPPVPNPGYPVYPPTSTGGYDLAYPVPSDQPPRGEPPPYYNPAYPPPPGTAPY